MICALALLTVATAFRVGEDVHMRGAGWMSKLEVKHVDILPNHLTSKLPSNWSSRFQIAGELGAGGFGKVFKVKVTCGPAEHFVSAKYIPRGFWWDERKLRKHLKNEVQEVERLQANWSEYMVSSVGAPVSVESPQTLDSVDVDGEFGPHPGVKAGRWVMMELLNGGSFRDLLKKCSEDSKCNCVRATHRACWEALPGMSLAYVLALAEEALEGLEAIHHHQLAHMDIKPDNIMLHCQGKRCYSKVIDLGTLCNAKSCDTSSVVGTRRYLAPEIFTFMPENMYIPENDVWAMGVTLYTLMYLDTPDYMDYWSRHKLEAYRPEKDSKIPVPHNDMDLLVMEMLNPDHHERIKVPAIRKRLAAYIESLKPSQEVLDMITKSPSERGLVDKLPPCAWGKGKAEEMGI